MFLATCSGFLARSSLPESYGEAGGDGLELIDPHRALHSRFEALHFATHFDQRDKVSVGEILPEQLGCHRQREVVVLNTGVVNEIGQQRGVVGRFGGGGIGRTLSQRRRIER